MNNEILILMDDSGKITKNENSCVYGGLFFFANNDYINFINKYKSIINSIKCKYCHEKNKSKCSKKCIEIKGTTRISASDSRRIFNVVKKENNFGVFINNKEIYERILGSPASIGRFADFAQKRIIKEIVMYAIKNGFINPEKEVKINIKIDNSKTKSNGYYNLKDSIYEELVNGIINYDYTVKHKPILKGGAKITVTNYDSKKHYGIQSADIMAHYLHRKYEKKLNNNEDIDKILDFIEVKLNLP